jgi:acetylornithine deacetylase/succinyl-diaminopimelate desuccinylase-like protein
MTFDPLTFHERAVRTPSHESVGEMRDLLVDTLDAEGADPTVDDAGNVLASRGSGHPHVVLNTHIDTVPPHVPFERDGTTVRGRGACDAKGPLAALLDAFFRADVGPGRVTLAVTPDEETHSTGAAALRGTLDADAVVVGEPTGLDVCTAAKGRFEGTVHLSGVNAHAAEPASGVNAVAGVEGALAAIRTFDVEHGPGSHDALGAPTLTPTVIRGGEATNQIPADCAVTVDRRSVPPETAAGFRADLTAHVREHVPEDVGVEFELTERDTPFLEAFATDPDDQLVTALVEASGGSVRPFTAATEASYFAEEAPTVVFGPGVLADESGAVAHADREYVERPDVEAAAVAVRETVEARCQSR